MGQVFSAFSRLFQFSKPASILMVGLDAVGKTTILYQLKQGEEIQTIPTIGFNVEEVRYKNVTFTIWDVGGGDKLKLLWHHYYKHMQAIIFVVDSADLDCMDQVHFGLTLILDAEIRYSKNAKVLVYANKIDLPGAADNSYIIEKMGLKRKDPSDWYIQRSNAKTGEGLIEGLAWLDSQLR